VAASPAAVAAMLSTSIEFGGAFSLKPAEGLAAVELVKSSPNT